MLEFLEVIFLIALNASSLILAGIGGAFSSASSAVHVLFIRRATRHDIKHGLTSEEQTAIAVANEANKPAVSQTKKTTNLQVN